MRTAIVLLCVLVALVQVSSAAPANANADATKPDEDTVRVAIIGGMFMTGMWPKVARMFEEETGYTVKRVVTGRRGKLAKALQAGKVDLLTMHSGDITTLQVALGYGADMRPWTMNNLVIAGPEDDPAGIKGMEDGAEAFKRIAATESNFIDFEGIGARETCHRTWHEAGWEHGIPSKPWMLQDKTEDHKQILQYAREKNAYVVVGRAPIMYGKMPSEGMEIMVGSDPDMRRPYVAMVANPRRFPESNQEGARKLLDFLLSKKVQQFLAEFGTKQYGGVPLFHPVSRYSWTSEE